MKNAKLRSEMLINGVSQELLAKNIGLAQSTVFIRLSKEGSWRTWEVENICKYLNIHDPKKIVDIFLPGISQNRDRK